MITFTLFLNRLTRPANIYGSYGRTVPSGDFKTGLIHVLRASYLDRFIADMRAGNPVKKALWFFKKEEDIADINDFLCEALPEFACDPSSCPWVVNFSSVGPATARSIREREGQISLYLTTAVMMMGIDLANIQVIGMVRPFSMLHSLVQAVGRGGRKTEEAGRQRVIFYLLYNASDIAENVDISADVRNFCVTDECLKSTMMKYFGTHGCSENAWCCSNCDKLAALL